MSVVCLDTQILFWAIVGKATHGAEDFIEPAQDFVNWLDNQGHNIIIPSIVVGEMLIPVEATKITQVLSQFATDWMVVDFDLSAARIFAQMRQDHIKNKRYEDIRRLHPDVTRKELVADAMIIATAVAHGADIIYSHNEDLRKLAAGRIEAKDFLDEL